MKRLAFFLFLFMSGAIKAQTPSAPVTVRYLPNGLQVIVKEVEGSPVVYSSMWYKVGGSYESNGKTGLSHLLEHLMFRGTQQIPARQFTDILQNDGATFNAATTADFTYYYELLPVQYLADSFKVEADRLRNLNITPENFAKEMQIVMEEARMRVLDNPLAVAQQRVEAATYVNSPYHNPVIGWMTDLQHLTVQDARGWYNTWYQPNNAILVVVGGVEAAQVFELAHRYFDSIPKAPLPVLPPRTEIDPLGTKSVLVKIPATTEALWMTYQTPNLKSLGTATWQAYALMVLQGVLAQGDSSRLQNDLVRTQKVASAVDANYDPFSLHSTAFQFVALPAQGKTLKELRVAIEAEIKQLQTSKITETELQKIKAQLIAGKIYALDFLDKQGELLGSFAAVNLPIPLIDAWSAQVKAVTAEQVQQVCTQFLVQNRLTIGRLRPSGPMNKTTGTPPLLQGVGQHAIH